MKVHKGQYEWQCLAQQLIKMTAHLVSQDTQVRRQRAVSKYILINTLCGTKTERLITVISKGLKTAHLKPVYGHQPNNKPR